MDGGFLHRHVWSLLETLQKPKRDRLMLAVFASKGCIGREGGHAYRRRVWQCGRKRMWFYAAFCRVAFTSWVRVWLRGCMAFLEMLAIMLVGYRFICTRLTLGFQCSQSERHRKKAGTP